MNEPWAEFVRACVESDDATAIVQPDGLQLNGRETLAHVAQIQRLLLANGLFEGKTVVAYLGHTASAMCFIVAAHCLGLVVAVVDRGQSLQGLAHALQLTSSSVAVTDSPFEGSFTPPARLLTLPSADTLNLNDARNVRIPAIDPHAPASVYFTSGSTGAPKGVVISRRAVHEFVSWGRSVLNLTAADTVASITSFAACPALLDIYAPISHRASVVLAPATWKFTPVMYARLMNEFRATVWLSVPSVWSLLIRTYGGSATFDALRLIMYYGEPASNKLLAQLRQLAPAARLYNHYGSTETLATIGGYVDDAAVGSGMPASLGQAIGTATLTLVDEEDQPVVGQGEGRLLVQSSTVMTRYVGGELTNGLWDTGDIVRRTADGHYFYVGRLDHRLNIRGMRFDLSEIEAAIGAHPAVRATAASLVEAGPESAIIVQFQADRPVGMIELSRLARQILRPELIPSRIIQVPSLPRLASGKLDRVSINQTAETGWKIE